jgi:bacillithiol system protein YtxJ
MPLVPAESIEPLEPLLDGREDGVVFKHSTRCPISRRADGEVGAFLSDHPDVPVHRILVVEDRPVSLAFAERSGVAHASPQALVLRGGRMTWHGSHYEITAKAIAEAWAG